MVAEDGGPIGSGGGAGQRLDEIRAVEEIVTKHESGGFPAGQETGVTCDVEGLRQAIGTGLFGVTQCEAELGAVAEELPKQG